MNVLIAGPEQFFVCKCVRVCVHVCACVCVCALQKYLEPLVETTVPAKVGSEFCNFLPATKQVWAISPQQMSLRPDRPRPTKCECFQCHRPDLPLVSIPIFWRN